MTLLDKATTVVQLALPDAGSTILPGGGDNKASIIMGWALGVLGILAFLAFLGAAALFFFGDGRGDSGMKRLGQIFGGLLIAFTATAIVRAFI